jgi:hypothetical protein
MRVHKNQRGASDLSIVMLILLGAIAIAAITSFNSCVRNYNRKKYQHWVEVPADYEGDVYVEKPEKPSLEDFE